MDVFHITGTPKARVQYFCAVSRKRQAFLKAYRRRSCLHNQTPKQFGEKKRKSLQEDQRPLIPFSVVDGVCLGKIGHEIYVTETWRIDLSLSKPSYLEIHNSYSSACSFSSYFFFSTAPIVPQRLLLLNPMALVTKQCCKGKLSHSTQTEGRWVHWY